MFRKDGYWSSNLKPKRDKQGKRWNFSYWRTSPSACFRAARLFYWDDECHETGVIIYAGESTRNYGQIAKIAEKLVGNPVLRREHQRDLRFPLDRYYAEFGSLPEEVQGAELPTKASKKIQSV